MHEGQEHIYAGCGCSSSGHHHGCLFYGTERWRVVASAGAGSATLSSPPAMEPPVSTVYTLCVSVLESLTDLQRDVVIANLRATYGEPA